MDNSEEYICFSLVKKINYLQLKYKSLNYCFEEDFDG